MILTWLRLQRVSHKGYVSKPPVPEEREAYRLHGEAVKKKKDAAKQAATRKRERKEKHEKECKIALTDGRPRPPLRMCNPALLVVPLLPLPLPGGGLLRRVLLLLHRLSMQAVGFAFLRD